MRQQRYTGFSRSLKKHNKRERKPEISLEELIIWPIPASGVGSVIDWERLRTGELDTLFSGRVITWKTMCMLLEIPYTPPPEFSLKSFLLRGIEGHSVSKILSNSP